MYKAVAKFQFFLANDFLANFLDNTFSEYLKPS